MTGTLFVCPTPIGNLSDISFRVLEKLKESDFIICEDTRHTLKLLNHYQIKKPLLSYHKFNENQRSKEIISRISSGENCALVSDAGMPGISDPGAVIIKQAIDAGLRLEVLPGASAFVVALVASGIDTEKFVFEGFVPSQKSERKKFYENIKTEERTTVIYESPHRLIDSLKDMLNILGDRNISVARELSKKFEENYRGHISQCIVYFSDKAIKGEFSIVISGAQKVKEEEIPLEQLIRKYLELGYSKKDTVKKISKDLDIPKNQVYEKTLEIEE